MKSRSLVTRNFSTPDEVLTFPKGRVENVILGDVTVGRLVQQPGWRWSDQVKPTAGTDSCQFHHVGVDTTRELASSIGVRFDDRGVHQLKGVPDPRHVFAVIDG